MEDDGRYSLPVRLLLNRTQRDRLLALCQREHADVVDIVTRIVGDYLDAHADLVPAEAAAPTTVLRDSDMLRRHLRRLKAQAQRMGTAAPPWLHSYIAELEQDLAQYRSAQRDT